MAAVAVPIGSPEVSEALERSRGCGPWFAADDLRGLPAGWMHARVLAEPGSEVLSAQLERIAVETGTANGRVLAGFFVHRYAWRLAAPAAYVHLATGALPDVGADAVCLDAAGDPIGIGFAGGWRGTSPETETWFRASLTAHFAPLIGTLRARLPLGRRAMWVIAADAWASAFVAAGEQLGCEREAVTRVRRLLLDPPGTAFRGRTSFFTLAVDGRDHTVVRRGSCCQSFRVDGELCSTCPRVPVPEQEHRVRAELAA
jgi:ferric iron reductase protein FhuF